MEYYTKDLLLLRVIVKHKAHITSLHYIPPHLECELQSDLLNLRSSLTLCGENDIMMEIKLHKILKCWL